MTDKKKECMQDDIVNRRKRIGIFDSGRGGYHTMQEIREKLPQYDYLFYGDIIHMPYGDKTAEEIREYTFAGLQWLFDQGCGLVIVACNTAAAYSIRIRQEIHPELKTLSVTIPGIESLIDHHVKSTLFLSTTATRESGILLDLTYRYGYTGSIELKTCPGLADLIEEDMKNPFSDEKKREIILQYAGDIQRESIVLACTHYGVWHDVFSKLYPNTIIIDPSQECAIKLVEYLDYHPEIEQLLIKDGQMEEYRTK